MTIIAYIPVGLDVNIEVSVINSDIPVAEDWSPVVAEDWPEILAYIKKNGEYANRVSIRQASDDQLEMLSLYAKIL